MSGASGDWADYTSSGLTSALEFLRANAPDFSGRYRQFIDLWPAVAASGDAQLIAEWEAIKTQADQYMYLITQASQFIDGASGWIKTALGLGEIPGWSTILSTVQQYFGYAALGTLFGAPVYMAMAYQQMSDFIRTAPDRMYRSLIESGMDADTATQTVATWMKNQQELAMRPGLTDNLVSMLKWGALIAGMVYLVPRLIEKRRTTEHG